MAFGYTFQSLDSSSTDSDDTNRSSSPDAQTMEKVDPLTLVVSSTNSVINDYTNGDGMNTLTVEIQSASENVGRTIDMDGHRNGLEEVVVDVDETMDDSQQRICDNKLVCVEKLTNQERSESVCDQAQTNHNRGERTCDKIRTNQWGEDQVLTYEHLSGGTQKKSVQEMIFIIDAPKESVDTSPCQTPNRIVANRSVAEIITMMDGGEYSIALSNTEKYKELQRINRLDEDVCKISAHTVTRSCLDSEEGDGDMPRITGSLPEDVDTGLDPQVR